MDTQSNSSGQLTFHLPDNRGAIWYLLLPALTCTVLGLSCLQSDTIGLGVALLAFGALLLSVFVWSCFRLQKLNTWRIAISGDSVALTLPENRSPWRKLPAFAGTLQCKAIALIETRTEAYRRESMTFTTQSFALKLLNGDLIILGEEDASEFAGRIAALREAIDQLEKHCQVPHRAYPLPESVEQVFGPASGWRLAIVSDRLEIDLPGIGGAEAVAGRQAVFFADIAAIQMRRNPATWWHPSDTSYALNLRSGDEIALGRSRSFDVYAPFTGGLAFPNLLISAVDALSRRSGIPIVE